MTEAIPWQQPLFMVYDFATDKKVPLTQERLDILLRTESDYGDLIRAVKDTHRGNLTARGAPPDFIEKWR